MTEVKLKNSVPILPIPSPSLVSLETTISKKLPQLLSSNLYVLLGSVVCFYFSFLNVFQHTELQQFVHDYFTDCTFSVC